MKIEFENGSEINTIRTNSNIRGVRSNFITLPCLDIETLDVVVTTIDLRDENQRYLPYYLLPQDIRDLIEREEY